MRSTSASSRSGPPYFDSVFVPLMTPLVFLMGVGPLARWKKASIPDLARRLRWAFGGQASSTALLAPFAAGQWKPGVAFGLALAFWVVAATFVGVRERLRACGRRDAALRRSGASRDSYWGMVVAHLGIAVCIVGVTMVKGYETERDVKMGVGDTVAVARLRVPLRRRDRATAVRTIGRRAAASRSAATARYVETLYPEKRHTTRAAMPMTNAAIDSSPSATSTSRWASPVDNGAWSDARLRKAVHHVGVVRLHHDGVRRLPRAVGPPLPHRAGARRRAAAGRGGGARRSAR